MDQKQNLPEETRYAIYLLRKCRLALLARGDWWDKIMKYEVADRLMSAGMPSELARSMEEALAPLLETRESIDCSFLENLELRLCRAAILRSKSEEFYD